MAAVFGAAMCPPKHTGALGPRTRDWGPIGDTVFADTVKRQVTMRSHGRRVGPQAPKAVCL